MNCSSKFRRRVPVHGEQGYILLTLMFIASLVILSLVALAPQMTQQIKRDQEEELIHRGVQYARAIQHFYKKTGRYPVRLEELDNFNNVRFLRKHYKDPVTGEDFKLLHFGDVQMTFGTGIPGAVAAANFGNTPGVVNPQATVVAQGGFNQVAQINPAQLNAQAQAIVPSAPGAINQATPDPSDTSTSSQEVASAAGAGDPGSNAQRSNFSSNTLVASSNAAPFGAPGQVFGGGPIVGVASTSTKNSIREFNKKNHYKDWQFIYDPSRDRGGLLNTPAQPNLNANNPAAGNPPPGPGQGQGVAPQAQPNSFGPQNLPLSNQPPDQVQQQ
ncbi:MAG: type II secretion system protein [Acidobacteria bacterium]|nr:type II secretion system protein [Acidobacteriota bacterium]MBV9483270.1 type II secretion system protein [Acidobacteriota bacterium]